MRKEQITFILAIVLGALFLWPSDDGDRRIRRRSFRTQGDRDAAPESTVRGPRFLGSEEVAWSRTLDNVYRAPRETEPLAPIDMPAPPLPPLPHPGLPLEPPVGTGLASGLRHFIDVDRSIDLTGDQAVELATAEEIDAEGNTVEGAPEEDPLDTVSFDELTPADRLRLSVREELLLKQREEQRAMAESARRKALDRIVYQGDGSIAGSVVHGTIEPVQPGDDVYELKLRFDAIVASDRTEEEQRRAKRELRFVWVEDRGTERNPRRQVMDASRLEAIEFSDTPRNRFELGRRRIPLEDVASHLRLAREIFEAGHEALAARHLEGFRDRGELSAAGLALLADAYRRSLAYDKELEVLQAAVRAHPDHLGLNARLGRLHFRIGLVAKARAAFARALEAEPNHAPSRLGMGLVLLEEGAIQEGLGHLREARNSRGLSEEDTARLLGLMGRAHLLLGQIDQAGRHFGMALDQVPEDPLGLAGRVVVTFLDSGPEAALAEATAARELLPLDGRLAYLQGLAQLRTGDHAAGRATLELAMGLDPLLSAPIHVAMSWLFETVGRAEAALGEAGEALVADPTSLHALRQRARLRFLTNDYGGARDDFLEVLARAPRSVDALVALGDVAFADGRPEDAERYYARANDLEPNYPDLFARRFVTASRLSRKAELEGFLRTIDARMERDPRIQAALGYQRYVVRREPQEALQRFRQLLGREGGSEAIRNWAQNQLVAVEENLSMERWRDDFERSGSSLLRDWERVVGQGINVALSDGRVAFLGEQSKGSMAPTVLYQVRNGRSFESFSIDLDLEARPGVWQGIGLIAFNRASRPPTPYPGMQERQDGGRTELAFHGGQVALSPDGKLRYRTLERGEMSEWQDLPVSYGGGPARLGLELIDRNASRYALLVDRRQVAELEFPSLGRWTRDLELQVFVQADLDKRVDGFAVDNAEIVTSKR